MIHELYKSIDLAVPLHDRIWRCAAETVFMGLPDMPMRELRDLLGRDEFELPDGMGITAPFQEWDPDTLLEFIDDTASNILNTFFTGADENLRPWHITEPET